MRMEISINDFAIKRIARALNELKELREVNGACSMLDPDGPRGAAIGEKVLYPGLREDLTFLIKEKSKEVEELLKEYESKRTGFQIKHNPAGINAGGMGVVGTDE